MIFTDKALLLPWPTCHVHIVYCHSGKEANGKRGVGHDAIGAGRDRYLLSADAGDEAVGDGPDGFAAVDVAKGSLGR